MVLEEISYLFDPVEDYQAKLNRASNLLELKEHIFPYRCIAFDAFEAVGKLYGLLDFAEWKHGLRKERKGHSNSEKWYERFMPILLPEVMFEVSMIAERFKVPWGLAYNRMKEVGKIKEINGIAYLHLGEK